MLVRVRSPFRLLTLKTMRKFDVYLYKDDTNIGKFLNVETVDGWAKIWYLSNNGKIVSLPRNEVYIKELPHFQ